MESLLENLKGAKPSTKACIKSVDIMGRRTHPFLKNHLDLVLDIGKNEG